MNSYRQGLTFVNRGTYTLTDAETEWQTDLYKMPQTIWSGDIQAT